MGAQDVVIKKKIHTGCFFFFFLCTRLTFYRRHSSRLFPHIRIQYKTRILAMPLSLVSLIFFQKSLRYTSHKQNFGKPVIDTISPWTTQSSSTFTSLLPRIFLNSHGRPHFHESLLFSHTSPVLRLSSCSEHFHSFAATLSTSSS